MKTVLWYVGILIHLWTAVISWKAAGLLGTIAALFFPALAEIFWAFAQVTITGNLFNVYTLAIMLYGLVLAMAWLFSSIRSTFSH